ncbi:high mobility group box domain-containing protein, partial [Blyttiomyces helicus]
IPRPSNSFILYRSHQHSAIASLYGHLPAMSNSAISKIASMMWQAEDPRVKARFAAKAEQTKLEHLMRHPDYKFKPK